jgi:hypothetical protein
MLGPRELFRHPVPVFSVANAMVNFCLVPGKGTNFPHELRGLRRIQSLTSN